MRFFACTQKFHCFHSAREFLQGVQEGQLLNSLGSDSILALEYMKKLKPLPFPSTAAHPMALQKDQTEVLEAESGQEY